MIHHFLLVYDHEKGRLIETREFGADSKAAVVAYSAKERELQDRRLIEIVLIGSDSIETVKLTHANYFNRSATLSKYLAGLGS